MADERSRARGGKVSSFTAVLILLAAFFSSLCAGPLTAAARPVAASILVDTGTGEVLYASNADAKTYPASLTKMMTLYLLFDAIKHGQIKMGDQIVFSAHAASQDATNLSVRAGDTIRIETAILSIVVRSANDTATAIGEKLGGSEWAFAGKMNAEARTLGMTNTVFRNANGLPDPDQHTTARDMAILGIALMRDFPEYYHYFSSESFTYHGVQYAGHNHILNRFDGADGIKTGYIRAAGFNLVTSAQRNGRRLIGVVLGGETPWVRDRQMVALLTKGFNTPMTTGTQLALTAPAKAATTPAVALATSTPVTTPAAVAAPALVAAAALVPVAVATNQAANAATTNAAVADTSDDSLLPMLKPGSELQLASAGEPDPQAIENVWHSTTSAYGVQIGAYSQYAPAQTAAVKVTRSMPGLLADARIVIDESNALYRARVMGLTKTDAEQACAKLHAQQSDCMVLYNTDGFAAKAN
jgi:D-alanyl-D-alanine carboxypeptidase